MKLSKLCGERQKELPSNSMVKSQILLQRAGFIKQVSMGIFSLLPPAQNIALKIQNIIREEMNKLDAQEVLLPVVMPKEMWEDSGRYNTIGDEMARFKDRNGHDMLLGMTHEEAAVNLCKNTIKSYDQLPFCIYQIQTKFRDEARPRAGLIRVREFTMKDAYSFHTSQSDLENYYNQMLEAYNRIFARVGLKNFIAVSSDTGMMGGSNAHEFMLLTDIGEDSIAICPECGYRANVEVAKSIVSHESSEQLPLEKVFTGKAKTINEVCEMLKVKSNQICKAVCYAIKGDNKNTLVIFIRGDLEVNEAKVKTILKKDIAPINLDTTNLIEGNIGCLNLPEQNIICLYDKSLVGENNLVTGANENEYHIKNLCVSRDLKNIEFVDVSKAREGDLCHNCKKGHLNISRGVEIGNIFQLGTKYTKSMNMTIHDENGKDINPIMGCYGIGVGRLLACVAEESSDDKGLVWPISIAPWEVYLAPLRIDDEQISVESNNLYSNLIKNGIEVLFDDRNVSAGVKFADSELMGIPFRIVISVKSLAENKVEVLNRATNEKIMISKDEIVSYMKNVLSK